MEGSTGSSPVIDICRRYYMKIGKMIVILFVTILMLSMVGVAVENTENVNVTVSEYKNENLDKNLTKEPVVIVLHTSKTGYLNYLEKYYSRNSTGALKLDSAAMYYNGTIENNTLTLKIKRPLNASGGTYSFVKAVVFIDNSKRLDSWLVTTEIMEPGQTEESPGFGIIIAVISVMFTVYILRRRKINR